MQDHVSALQTYVHTCMFRRARVPWLKFHKQRVGATKSPEPQDPNFPTRRRGRLRFTEVQTLELSPELPTSLDQGDLGSEELARESLHSPCIFAPFLTRMYREALP